MPLYKRSECSSNCGDDTCFPCLPRCHRSEITYCCEKKPSECHMRCCEDVCCDVPKVHCKQRTPPRVASPVCHHYHQPRCSPPRSPVFFSRPRSPQLECCSPAPRRYYSPPPPECCTPIPDCRQYKVCCQPVRTKYVIPCYRYEDGRIVRKLPVTAFKRNGMQDQEHSKLLGTANFLQRCPRDVAIEYDVCKKEVYVCDPLKVPKVRKQKERPLGSKFLSKKPENQPTVLMRRACEVAVGVRPRRKPFVEASYCASDDQEVRRYHSEDQMGNCCYHFEKKNTGVCEAGSFTSCIPSTVANPAGCCVYY